MDYFEEKTSQVEPAQIKAFGITIISRYGKAKEIREMLSFCEEVALKNINCFNEIFYDSKSCTCFFTFEFQSLSSEEEEFLFKAARKTISQFQWKDGCVYNDFQ